MEEILHLQCRFQAGLQPFRRVWFRHGLRPAGLQPAGWRRQGWEEEQGVGEKAWGGSRTVGWMRGDWGREEKTLIGGGLVRWFCLTLQSHVTKQKTTQANDEWTWTNVGPACSYRRVEYTTRKVAMADEVELAPWLLVYHGRRFLVPPWRMSKLFFSRF
jgi:hypothetical protein